MSVPDHVHESIDALADLHSRTERDKSRHQHAVEQVANAVGRPRSLYLLALVSIGWVVSNLALPHYGLRAFDPPPFGILQALSSVVALGVAIMVLIVQNRQSAVGQKRSILDLQINLMAERKTTKVIELLEALRRDTPSVANRVDHEANEMSTALDPKVVADALEKSLEDDDETAPKKP